MDEVSYIVYHANWYGPEPWTTLNPTDHLGRFNYYPIGALPTLMVDGLLDRWPITPSLLETAVNNRLAVESPIQIEIASTVGATAVEATITVTNGDAVLSGNYKLRIGLVENFYDGWTGSNGQSEWHFDMLEMAPSHAGQDIDMQPNDVQTFDVSFSWPVTLNNDLIENDNISIVAFVQNDTSHEVVQSAMELAGTGQQEPAVLTLTPQVTDIPVGGGTVVYDVSFVNNTAMSANGLRYRTYVTLPNGTRVGPTANIPFNLTPFMDITVTGLTQDVPSNAPAGTYTFQATAGVPNNPNLMVMDTFEFTKAGSATDAAFTFDADDWSASGFEVTDDATRNAQLPHEYAVGAAYPNPFNPETTISVSLPETADLTVAVYNIAGQQVATLHNGSIAAGTHALSFNASSLASGLYFVRATVPGQLDHTQKVMLVR
ncbi:T9SS type A sorting domain-containing protein [bacterium]|nr:T9SS type A sorting domain-containing protein [bacterium]